MKQKKKANTSNIERNIERTHRETKDHLSMKRVPQQLGEKLGKLGIVAAAP